MHPRIYAATPIPCWSHTAYDSVYEAVRDRYGRDDAWAEFVHVGDRTELNIADEALTRHDGSDRVGLRLRDFDTGETETYTFEELNRAADRVALPLEHGEAFME